MRGILHEGARLAALFLFVAYAFSFAAPYFWFADLFRHFVFQYLIGAVILLVTLAAFRAKVGAAVMLVIALSCLFEIYRATPQAQPPAAVNTSIKIAHFNKLFLKPNHDGLMQWIETEQADILVIQEADAQALQRLQERSDYPYVHHKIYEQNPFGFIFLSKHEIKSYDLMYFAGSKLENPYFKAVVSVDGHDITIFSAHPAPPVDYTYATQRNTEIAALTERIVQDKSSRIIVSGDFNITPYSPYFKGMIRKTALRNEYSSFLIPASWPSWYFDYIFQVPIDHILHKGDLELIEKRRGPHLGSDHYSLIATYALK